MFGLNNEEAWKDVPGYEGYYQVSSYGTVRSLSRRQWNGHKYWYNKEKVLRPGRKKRYDHLQLSKGNKVKTFQVHQLVASTFMGPQPVNMDVCHLDNNPKNNKLSNLKYVSRKENESHKKMYGTLRAGEKCNFSKLKEIDVSFVRYLHKKGVSKAKISKMFKVSWYTIFDIITGKTWNSFMEAA